jgi:hypothetical protein
MKKSSRSVFLCAGLAVIAGVCLAVGFSFAGRDGSPRSITELEKNTALSKLRQTVDRTLAADELRNESRDANARATRPRSGLQARFDAEGAHFRGPGAPPLALRLVGCGRGDSIAPIAPVAPAINAREVDYRHGTLTEWWRTLPTGYEQGFTLASRPAGDAPLTIALSANGAAVNHDGTLAWGALRYGKLAVTDANGRDVPATLRSLGAHVLIAVNDACATYPLTIDPLVYVDHKITATDGEPYDGFGYSLALDGSTAVVGAPSATVNGNEAQGAVYIFRLTNGQWIEEQELTASDGAAFDDFGNGVAISGKTVIAGSPDAAINGNAAQGAAYVFNEGNGNWTETQKLLASNGAGSNEFGTSIAMQGATALIGAIQLLHGPGAAYIFNNNAGTWSETQELISKNGSDTFGDAVALDGDNALVGAQQTAVNGGFDEGAAFIFNFRNGTWKQTATLVATDGTMFDSLGCAVAIEGSTAIAGADGATINGKQKGAAYIFTEQDGKWSFAQRLTASDGRARDGFGSSVALKGAMALIGEDQYSNNGTGKAYAFANTNGSWTERARLLATDGQPNDEFGHSVALDYNNAFIGAPNATVGSNSGQGAVYVGQFPANR